MRYLLAFMTIISLPALATCRFEEGWPPYSYESDTMHVAQWHTVNLWTSLDKIQVMAEAIKLEPKLAGLMIQEMQKELDHCKLWLSLQHSD